MARARGRRLRPPAVADAFYPADAGRLRQTVDEMLTAAGETDIKGTVLAAAAPHAGYVFSGRVAACTFKAIANTSFDTMVIIGHDCYGGAVAYLSGADAFETPLGKVAVDVDMVRELLNFSPGIRLNDAMHGREHTVELQLPFLQAAGRQCKIVPVLFGDPTPENCRTFADAMAAASEKRKVFVLASCDMSHYPSYEDAVSLDRATLKALQSMDIDALFAHFARAERGATPGLQTAMCAKGGVGAALLFAINRGADNVKILKYANSGDVPAGDKRRVVGYGSAVMLKSGE